MHEQALWYIADVFSVMQGIPAAQGAGVGDLVPTNNAAASAAASAAAGSGR